MLKVSVSVVAFVVSFFLPQSGLAAPAKLTGLAVKRSTAGVNIDLAFDRPVTAKALKPGFERNFVQLVLKGARIDSAKIMAVSDSEVQKVFAYPYNPDTARVRVILKKDNEWAKGRISLWNNNPKSVRVFIREPMPKAEARTAEVKAEPKADARAEHKPESKPVPVAAKSVEKPSGIVGAPPAEGTVEEKTILKEVLNNTRDIDINNPDSVKAALRGTQKPAAEKNPEKLPLGQVSAVDKTPSEEKSGAVGIKNDPSHNFARMALALFAVVALFVGGVVLVKKYASKIKKLPFGKKERLIQVVATHYLGNKKSISLVKITGEYMVVGVSNEGISLISKLGSEVNVEKYLEDRFWGGTFEKHLGSYAKDQAVAKEIDLSTYDGAKDLNPPAATAAAQVEDKVQLSPVRASIKEKLTKLKPLA